MEDFPSMGGMMGGPGDDGIGSPASAFPKAQKLDPDASFAGNAGFGSSSSNNGNNNNPFDEFPGGGGAGGGVGGMMNGDGNGNGNNNPPPPQPPNKASSGGLLAQALMEKKGPRTQATTLNVRSPPYSGGFNSIKSPPGPAAAASAGISKDQREQLQRINNIMKNPNLDQRKRSDELNKIIREHPDVYRTLIKLKGQQQQMGGGGAGDGVNGMSNMNMGGMNPGMRGGDNGGFDGSTGVPNVANNNQPWNQNGNGMAARMMQPQMNQQRFMSPQQQQQQQQRFPMQQQQMLMNGSGMDGAMWDHSQQYQQPQQQFRRGAGGMGMQPQQVPPPSYPYGGRGGPRIRPGMPNQMPQQQMGQHYQNEYPMQGGYSGMGPSAIGPGRVPLMGHQGPAGGGFGPMPSGSMMDGTGMYQGMGMRPMGPMGMQAGPMSPAAAARMNQMQQQQMCQQPFIKQEQQTPNEFFLQQQQQMSQDQKPPQQNMMGFPSSGFPPTSVPDSERMSGGSVAQSTAAAGGGGNGGGMAFRGGDVNQQSQQQQSMMFDDPGFGGLDGGQQQQQQQQSWKTRSEGQQHRSLMRSRLQEAVRCDESLSAEAERVETEAFARCDSMDAYNQEIAVWLAGIFQRGALPNKEGGEGGDNLVAGGNSNSGSMSDSSILSPTSGNLLPQELNATATEALQGAVEAAEKPVGGSDFLSTTTASGSSPSTPASLQPRSISASSPSASSSSTRRSLSEQNPILSKLLPAVSSAPLPPRSSSVDGCSNAGDQDNLAADSTTTTSAANPSSSPKLSSSPVAAASTPSQQQNSAPPASSIGNNNSSSTFAPSDTPSVSSTPASSSSSATSSTSTTNSMSSELKTSSSADSSSAPLPFQSPPSVPAKGGPPSSEQDHSKSPPNASSATSAGSQLQRGARRASGKGQPPLQQQQGGQPQTQTGTGNNNPYSVDSGFGSPRSNTSASLCSPKIQGTSPSLAPNSESSPEK